MSATDLISNLFKSKSLSMDTELCMGGKEGNGLTLFNIVRGFFSDLHNKQGS